MMSRTLSCLLIFFVIFLMALSPLTLHAQSNEDGLGERIRELIANEDFEELLDLLAGAPGRLSQEDLFHLRVLSLFRLNRLDEALRQAQYGINLITQSKTAEPTQGLALLEFDRINILFSLAKVDEVKKSIQAFRETYTKILPHDSNFWEQLDQVEKNLSNYDATTFSLRPDFSPDSNVNNGTDPKVIEALRELNRQPRNSDAPVAGWNIGLSFSGRFHYHLNASERFSTNVSTNIAYSIGPALSHLDEVSELTLGSSNIEFEYSHVIAQRNLINPSISLTRRHQGAYVTGQTILQTSLRYRHAFSSDLAFEVSPFFSTAFKDVNEGYNATLGLSGGIDFSLPHFAGSRPTLGFNTRFEQSNFFKSKEQGTSLRFSLPLVMRPRDYLDVGIHLIPHVTFVTENEASLSDIPSFRIISGLRLEATIYALSLIPNTPVHPVIIFETGRVFSQEAYLDQTYQSLSITVEYSP